MRVSENVTGSKLARKFLPGDVVSHTLKPFQYKIVWINYNKDEAGICKNETPTRKVGADVVPLAELELVKPSIHAERPFKPIKDMSEAELWEHVRLLRKGRQESVVAMSTGSSGKSKSKSKKTKTKTKSKTAKLKEKYPDLPDSVYDQMLKQGEKTICTLMGIEYKGD